MEDLLGVAGFVIATGLAALHVWEIFFRRPKFHADVSWHTEEGDEFQPTLAFCITNVGHTTGTIREMWLEEGGNDERWAPGTWSGFPR